MPKSVRQLKQRADAGVSIDPDSNKGIALTLLAENPGEGFTPTEIAKHTEVKLSSAPKTMQRLASDGYTVSIDGHHFIPSEKLGDIRAVLTNAHAAKSLDERPRGEVEWDEVDEQAANEADKLVESLSDVE